MKKISRLGLLSVCFLLEMQIASQPAAAASSSTLPAPTPYTVVSQDADSAVWERTSYQRAPDGRIVSHLDRYVELATGLNHLVNGEYVPSSDQIELSADGTSASATNGQHQAYFPADIENGVIKLVTPDGKTLQSQPIGLGYFDGSNSVLLAVLTNSTGEILPSGNEVMYTNAFAGVDADLLYKYTRAGFEQDVILREQPPDPAVLGLNPAKARIQVLTEFLSAPQPVVATNTIPTATGNLEDETLNFGAMQMGLGNAFLLGTSSLMVGVVKQWLVINNRQFLVEEVPFQSITNELSQLPPQTAFVEPHSSLQVASNFSSRSRGNEAQTFEAQTSSTSKQASLRRLLLLQTRSRQRLAATAGKCHMQLTQNAPSTPGLVLDYVTLNSYTNNFTFQGDTTYYISGTVSLTGNRTFEGGAVIKYTNGVFLLLGQGSVNCLASAYRPVIFTAVDDNSVGETINVSTGHPTNYYASPALLFNETPSVPLQYFRIEYANLGIMGGYSAMTIKDSQFVNDLNAVRLTGGSANLENVLMDNVASNAIYLSGSASCIAQNLTVHNANTFYHQGTSGSLALTNSLLVAYANLGSSFNGAYNYYTNSSDTGIFQTAGGAANYLAANCPSGIRDAGTTNIDPALLADLRTSTTYPPNTSFVGQTITTNATLYPLGLADTNAPDLGYHYPILDYVFSQCQVNGGSVTFEPGTAVGWYGQGLSLTGGTYLDFDGLGASPCYFVRCNTVQEQDTNGDAVGITSADTVNYTSVNATFARFSAAGDLAAFFDASSLYDNYFYNCEFWDGLLGGTVVNGTYGPYFYLFNCLLDRSGMAFYTTNSSPGWGLEMQNCTLHGGSLYLSQLNPANVSASDAQVYDSAFDGTEVTVATSEITTANHNAYLTNAATLPGDTGDPDPQTNFNWQIGPLGNYYLPPDSPLINAGNGLASGISDPTGYNSLTHLDIYTTQTNQTPEGSTTVDIGYQLCRPFAYEGI